MSNLWFTSIAFFAVLSPLVGANCQDLQQAQPGTTLSFPVDHGSHPNYQTEWWYYTGQLFLKGQSPFKDSAAFGFQLTFFRRAKIASDSSPDNPQFDQSYLAHAAISDLRSAEFLYESRAASDILDLAGAKVGALDVWNRDWRVSSSGGPHRLEFTLFSKDGREANVQLTAHPSGAPVLHGEGGFSRKGRDGASIYYSLPRLELQGEVRLGNRSSPVSGLGWMDHEFMSNALGRDQVGWDWISLMQADGTNLMLFKVRGRTPEEDFYSGTLVRDGEVHSLSANDFTLTNTRRWTSPKSGASYPVVWQIAVPRFKISEELIARLDKQEIVSDDVGDKPIAYWEGAVGSSSGNTIGYLEMTGYDREFDQLRGTNLGTEVTNDATK